jgi:hypothetical protein
LTEPFSRLNPKRKIEPIRSSEEEKEIDLPRGVANIERFGVMRNDAAEGRRARSGNELLFVKSRKINPREGLAIPRDSANIFPFVG